jgi:hypothetical protein
MRGLSWALFVMLHLASLPALAAEPELLARWVQYGADGAAEARVVAAAGQCPAISIDGQSVPMKERAAPNPAFPARICVAAVPSGARRIVVLGAALPAPKAAPSRIVVLGDTGCRVLKRSIQDCHDPAAWPLARVAAAAAAKHPDLVIHVGDYLYRETPCPAGDARCAGSPSGDRWRTWRADLFAPAAPLLRAAPWVAVRGNHEECARAGRGWTRLLSAAPVAADTGCTANEPPFAVPVGSLNLIVLDDANAPDAPPDAALAPVYREDFARVAALAKGPSWLLMHRPLRGIVRLPSGAVVGGNATMLATAPDLPAKIGLLLSGHIHDFEAINYDADLPPQLIAGNGGDNLDTAPADLAGIAVGGVTVKDGLTLPGFGFLLLTRETGGWRVEAFSARGALERRCRIAGRRIDCRSA